LLLDGVPFPLLRFGNTRLGALHGRLRRDHQPALGHAVVTQLQAVIASRLIKALPQVRRERLGDHLRNQLERARNAGDKAEFGESRGMSLVIEFGLGDELPRRWSLRKRRQQGRSPLLENLGIRRIPIPAFAHHGYATILRDQQLQNGLFQVWSVVFGIAVGDGNGLLVALGDVVATRGKAGRVEMMEALVNAFP
jgi:hypothetical protein